MKIGDKVRFLNEVGGGIVAGFQGKNTVLVEDEDGFEIPMLITECVVIDTNDYNIPVKTTDNRQQTTDNGQQTMDDDDDEAHLLRPMTFKAKPVERRGGDMLNISLGFTPVNIRELSNSAFEMYLINDCNYTLSFTLLTQTNCACHVRHTGVIEPNTKLFLEEFDRSILPELEKLTLQAIAYKEEKPFLPKAPVYVGFRLDCPKFYKLHTFGESLFFEHPSYIVDVMKDDQPARSVFIDAKQLRDAILEPKREERPQVQTARNTMRNGIIEVDLHASAILETEQGMDSKAILEYQLQVFHDEMKQHIKKKGTKIVFIHGKGDGVLRNALIKELRQNYKTCIFQDASFREYGFGATMVIVK